MQLKSNHKHKEKTKRPGIYLLFSGALIIITFLTILLIRSLYWKLFSGEYDEPLTETVIDLGGSFFLLFWFALMYFSFFLYVIMDIKERRKKQHRRNKD
jgi:hypothetical protein